MIYRDIKVNAESNWYAITKTMKKKNKRLVKFRKQNKQFYYCLDIENKREECVQADS